MVHYKCSRCKFILKAEEDLRGSEHTCPHCGTVNLVPGGTAHPHRHQKDPAHPTHPEPEEVPEPVTVGKVLKSFLWALLAIVSAGAVGLAIYYRAPNPSVAMIEPFEPFLNEFADIEPKDVSADKTPGAYIVGKAVVVNFMDDEAAKVLGEIGKEEHPHVQQQANGLWRGMNWREFARLPEAIRAASYEDVQTVVWVRWSLQNVAQAKKESRYQVICDLSVIDKAKGLIVGKTTLRGERPPLQEPGMPFTVGSRPSREIGDYISELPRYKTDDSGRLIELPKGK